MHCQAVAARQAVNCTVSLTWWRHTGEQGERRKDAVPDCEAERVDVAIGIANEQAVARDVQAGNADAIRLAARQLRLAVLQRQACGLKVKVEDIPSQ